MTNKFEGILSAHNYYLQVIVVFKLRRNPPGLRVLHGQNYVPKYIIYILLQTSVLLFQIYYQKKLISNNTKHPTENKFRSSTEFQ